MKDYEKFFQQWKLSGFHDDFGQVPKQPFSDYTKGAKSLLYVHEFVFQNPGIFDTVTRQLPPAPSLSLMMETRPGMPRNKEEKQARVGPVKSLVVPTLKWIASLLYHHRGEECIH
eukprot:scaffold111489_cov28-Attheya_sp.AAC.1